MEDRSRLVVKADVLGIIDNINTAAVATIIIDDWVISSTVYLSLLSRQYVVLSPQAAS